MVNKNNLSVLLLLLCSIILSCSDERTLEKALKGAWAIDTIYYKNYNVKNCLGINFIDIQSKEDVFLPKGNMFCDSLLASSNSNKAQIYLLKSNNVSDTIPYTLKIITENKVFSGSHEMVFYRDKKNYLFKLELYSDSLYVMCHKILFDYNKNHQIMEKVENLTWTTRPK